MLRKHCIHLINTPSTHTMNDLEEMKQELAEELCDASPELSNLDIDPDDGNNSKDTGS